ncbi:CrcB family protein [Actinophytocola sp.]|uniref:fluoride efflux transporter FluC n=1 Tax=Actinophytocola sp. TaxID=1872138 RepID=UPI0025C3B82C|nr:CrcB family protein [Actinophytocola sp.]
MRTVPTQPGRHPRGGFTTFSTYAVEIRGLLHPGAVGLAFTYLAGTLIAALIAVLACVWATRTAGARERAAS